jgi:formamidopyrimidine-DNA glycosylase
MPELPEVETVRRGLQPFLEGREIAEVVLARPRLRYDFPTRFAERLAGRTVRRLDRRAKYLLAELDDGSAWLSHLGMTGSFRVVAPGETDAPADKSPTHDHVRLRLGDGHHILYNDPRRFGFMDLFPLAEAERSPHLAGLGPEPLSNAFSAATLAAAARGRRTPLKALLLDQRVVAGLGNIYVCEALWRAGLSPLRPAGEVADADAFERLTAAIRAVLTEAIAAGGSTLRDYRHADGSLGYFQHTFSVYDREGTPCPRPGCGGTIVRQRQAGRSTFLCELCQR